MVIKKINGVLTKVPETAAEEGRLKKFEKTKETRQFRDLGVKLTKQLDPKKFIGTVEDYQKALNSIDSRIKPFIGVNMNSIKQEQQRRVNVLLTNIKRSDKDIFNINKGISSETGFEKEKSKASIDGLKARQSAAKKLINRIKGGELLDLTKVGSFLSEVERETTKESKLRRFTQEKALQSRAEQLELAKAKVSIDLNKFVGAKLSETQLASRGLNKPQILAIKKAEIANRNLSKELVAIKLGQTSPGKLLKEGKIDANQATKLVMQFELSASELRKIRNVNVASIFERLTSKKSSITAVDTTTQIRAFKVGVNQALAKELEKPLPFNSSIDKFNKTLRELELKKKKNLTVARRTKAKAIGKQTLSIENKFLTGQTITPTEKKIFLDNVARTNKALDKQQLRLAVKILGSPVVYLSSLKERRKRGERAPLVKDLLKVGKGIGLGLKELFVDPLVGSFNYGRSLVIRAKSQGTAANKIFIKDIKILASGVKNVSTFAKNNPVATGIIVGAAVSSGLKLSKSEFKRNPQVSLGRAIAWFFPGKVIKVGGKAISSTAKGIKKTVSNVDKFIKLKTNKSKNLSMIKNEIKLLKSKGIKPNQRTLKASKLRLLLEEKRILEIDLFDLNKILESSAKPIKTKADSKRIDFLIKKTDNSIKKNQVKTSKIKRNKDAVGRLLGVENKDLTKFTKKKQQQIKRDLKLLFGKSKESKTILKESKQKVSNELKLPSKEIVSLNKEFNRLKTNLFELEKKRAFKEILNPKVLKRLKAEINAIKKFIKITKEQKIFSQVFQFKTKSDKAKFINQFKKEVRKVNLFSEFQKEFFKLDKKLKKIPNFEKLLKFSDSQLKSSSVLTPNLVKSIKLYRKGLNFTNLKQSSLNQLILSLKKINKAGSLIKKTPKTTKLKISTIKKIISKPRISKTEISRIISSSLRKKQPKEFIQNKLKLLDKNINEIRKAIFEAQGLGLNPKELSKLKTISRLKIENLIKQKQKIKVEGLRGKKPIDTKQLLLRQKLHLKKIKSSKRIEIKSLNIRNDFKTVSGNLKIGDYVIQIEYNFRGGKIAGKRGRLQNPISVKIKKVPKKDTFGTLTPNNSIFKNIERNFTKNINNSLNRNRFNNVVNNQKKLDVIAKKISNLKIKKGTKLKSKQIKLQKELVNLKKRSKLALKDLLVLSLGSQLGLTSRLTLKSLQSLQLKQKNLLKQIQSLLKDFKKPTKPSTSPRIKRKLGGSITTVKRTKKPSKSFKKPTPTQLTNLAIRKFLTTKSIKKFRLPNLKLTSKIKGTNLSFNIRIRRKGKSIIKRLELPINKALKEAIKIIKKSPARSTELFLVGLTKESDIKRPSLKDFRLRKKNSKALLLVEVPKSAIKGIRRK